MAKCAEHGCKEPGLDSLSGKSVVIVEDEGITQLQIRKALGRAGLSVVGAACNGQEGVEMALRQRPDIVLMDVRMPVMDGLEAARRILSEFRVCLVMLTACGGDEYYEKARAVGASGYVLKPVISDALIPQLLAAYAAYAHH